jgi:putative aldouronate transport system substrate-binding protein
VSVEVLPATYNSINVTWSAVEGATQYQIYRSIQKTIPTASFAQMNNLGGEKSDFSNTSLGWAGTFITTKCKTPEAAIKFCQYMFTTEGMRMGEWGREGIEYTVDANGVPTFSADFLDANKDSKVLYTKYNPSWIFGVDPVMEAIGRAVSAGATSDNPQDKEIRSRVIYSSDIPLCLPKADTDEDVIIKKLDNLRGDRLVKVYLSASDDEFEKNYQELMAGAKTIGIDQLNDFLTANLAKLAK